jgi:hypothetical protein
MATIINDEYLDNSNLLADEETDEETPDFVDFLETITVFKPNSIQRMKCVPVGEPINCQKTDCNQCDYDKCDVKKKMKIRNEKIAEWKKKYGCGNTQ